MRPKRLFWVMMLSCILVINSSVPVCAADSWKLTLNGTIKEHVFDTIEFGSTDSTYQFDEAMFEGMPVGDKIYLVADSQYDSTDVGERVIKLTNFRLEGEDAEKYELPEIIEPVEKEICITPKVIYISPAKNYIYYGQGKPEKINELADYSDQTVSGNAVNIDAEFEINENGLFGIMDGTLVCDNNNYVVAADDTIRFEVREYDTIESAVSTSDAYVGVKKAVLEAPEGYLISSGNLEDSVWSSFIEIDLEETQAGEAFYFLRRNDSSDTEYNQAISKEKVYRYSSDQTLPQINNLIIEKKDESTTLNLLPFGVFANGKVDVTVEAVGTTAEQDTIIYFGEPEAYMSKQAMAECRNGVYYYTAVFTCDISRYNDLQAYAVNSSGNSEGYTVLSGMDDASKEFRVVDENLLVVEKQAPQIENPSFISDSKGVTCELTVSDGDAGIAKVEYGWDIQDTLLEDERNEEGNAYGFRQNNYSKQYLEYFSCGDNIVNNMDLSFELSYEDAVWVKENRHTLCIRVTDNAGNVYEREIKDSVGSDMNPPNITNIEIRKADTSIAETVLRFLLFGIFSNNTVEIVAEVDDFSEDNTYASGVEKVLVNYGHGKSEEMVRNQAGEYVAEIPLINMYSEVSISAEDAAGWVTTTNAVKSNYLVVENSKPKVSVTFSHQGYVDDSGCVWYGAREVDETIAITVSDISEVQKDSGLYSVKILDNDKILYQKTDFEELKFEETQIYKMGSFEDGVHIITVLVEDNAGNFMEEQYTFSVDTVFPTGGPITVLAPEGMFIEETRWFDKEEIVELRADAADIGSGLKEILIKVNDKIFLFGGDKLQLDDDGYYVLLNIEEQSQKYNISGMATDYANNEFAFEDITICKDFESPVIYKILVEGKNAETDNLPNALPFGVYANSNVILKAYVSDIDADSGIEGVTLFYDGLEKPKEMSSDGDDIFYSEISVGTEIFESNIHMVAYDKYGKSSTACPRLTDAEGNSVSDKNVLMIERIEPCVTVDIPDGDDLMRSDGQKWYNTNKEIKVTVQDNESGINNINLTVNGTAVEIDKNGISLLKASFTETAASKNTDKQEYIFDTDFLTNIAGMPQDGRYVFNIEVMDNAGNLTSKSEVYFIDNTAPKIDRIEFSAPTAEGVKNTSEFIERLEYGFYFKTDFHVTVYVSDEMPSAGLKEVKYRMVPYANGVKQEEVIGTQKIIDGRAELLVPQGFKGQIFVEAFDNLGNRSGEKTSKAYIVDNNAPIINITKNVSTAYHDADGNELFTVDNSITVEITDSISGIKEIGYSKSAEQDFYERIGIDVSTDGYKVGDGLGDGWIVTMVDNNLVTGVSKTFEFAEDDNNVFLTFDATDNATNMVGNVNSEKFTIDKIRPIINVSFREDEDNDRYYAQNRVADIVVTERNFDEELIKVVIENSFGDIPSFSFLQKTQTEYIATIEFDEGDYVFGVEGTDLGNQSAVINFSGGNETHFYVDKTAPYVTENFNEFINRSTENSFNFDKTVNISIKEHNFAPDLSNIIILKKTAGSQHVNTGFIDVTKEVLKDTKWSSMDDIHTISFSVSQDAVYQVMVTPVDLAGNVGEKKGTVIFEIDKTAPIVTAKNGMAVRADNTEYIDVYSYLRADEPAPSVEFSDLNIDYIEYELMLYIPKYLDTEKTTVIKPIKAYLEEDIEKTGAIKGSKFVLPNFVEDGVYALKLVAVDVAGNKSDLNLNTYVRLVEQDVLAYIMESDLEQGTGLYSIQYENGDAISKRPDDFKDIQIFAVAERDTPVDIVLRDNNGNEINTHAKASVDNSIYGVSAYTFTLDAAFIKENFQEDVDVELFLSVKNKENRIDLGKIHIDNIAPTGDVPAEFKSWKWYFGEDSRTITISNISELIDVSQCKVYDNGREITFTYSEESDTVKFTLEKGWHNVGVVLKDLAGNSYNIQERTNIYIGFFWLWVIAASSVAILLVSVYAVVYFWKKKRREENVY